MEQENFQVNVINVKKTDSAHCVKHAVKIPGMINMPLTNASLKIME